MRPRIGALVHQAALLSAVLPELIKRDLPTMQSIDALAADDVIVDAKTAADIYPIRQKRSMLEQTTMMVAGIDQEKLDQRRLKHQRKLPGKPVRQKASKSKRKQAAKSRARNRR